MREQRDEMLKKMQHSLTSESYSNNKNNKNRYDNDFINLTCRSLNIKKFPVKKVYIEKNDYDKLYNLIIKLKDYNEFVEKFSSKEKDNFINLQRILNILSKGEFNFNH